jgi:hypothetical protein
MINLHVAKLANHKFTAAVSFKAAPGGWVVSDVQGKRTTAIKNLEAKLRVFGVQNMPEWNVVDLGTITPGITTPATNPESTTTPVQQSETPAFTEDDEDDAPTLRTLDTIQDQAEQAIEDAKESVTGAFNLAPRMEGGWVTPLSDKAAWVDVFRQVRAKFDGVDFTIPDDEGSPTIKEKRWEAVSNYREAINTVMEAASFVGPWRRTIGGDCWIRFSGEVDHTVRQPKAGEGKYRTSYDLSPKKAPRLARKSAEKSAGPKSSKGEKYSYPGDENAYAQAFKFARSLSTQSKEAGNDVESQKLAYKIGMCVSLRSQNAARHEKFESDIKELGVTEEYLSKFVSAQAA